MERRLLLTDFVVNTTADIVAADGFVSLREAIQAASTNAAVGDAAAGTTFGDQVRISPNIAGMTIDLTSGELAITDDLTIVAGASPITIDAGGVSRVFNVSTSETVFISGLTLVGGFTTGEGGAVAVSGGGLTRLDRMTIAGNVASGAGGGGISNVGAMLFVVDSVLQGNNANGASGSGGAILNGAGGRLTVVNSRIEANLANRAGGGIEDASGAGFGTTLRYVSLNANNVGLLPGTAAPGNGGGLHVTGASDVDVFFSVVSGNFAAREGGGLWNDKGRMTVLQSIVTGNTASGVAADDGGGGIFNNGGALVVDQSIVSNNQADGTAGSGGGIFSIAGTVAMNWSTILFNIANRAGGGVEVVAGDVTINLGKLVGNLTGPSGAASPGNGGGLHVTGAANVSIMDTVVSFNVAAKEGGGLWNSSTGRLSVSRSSVNSNKSLGTAAGDGGGGIFNNDGGTLLVVGSAVFFNRSAGDGAGIFNGTGAVADVSGSSLFGNAAAGRGGGIFNDGDLNVQASFVIANTAAEGPSIFTAINGDTDVDLLFLNLYGLAGTAGPGTIG